MARRTWVCAVVILGMLWLPACMSHHMEMGKKIDKSTWSMIVQGKTTEAEVLELLGEPNQKMLNSNGTKTYTYMYHETTMSGGGLFSNPKVQMTGENYTVGFDQKGIVSDIGQNPSSMGEGRSPGMMR